MCQLEAALTGMKSAGRAPKDHALCRTCSSLVQSKRAPRRRSISARCEARTRSGTGTRNRCGIVARLSPHRLRATRGNELAIQAMIWRSTDLRARTAKPRHLLFTLPVGLGTVRVQRPANPRLAEESAIAFLP
jgi:hypothetical protein